MVKRVPGKGEPAVRQHHRIEFIAMQHHQPPPVRRLVESSAADFDAAEIQPGELAEHLVMIAGDIDDPRTAPGAFEQPPDDVIVRTGQ